MTTGRKIEYAVLGVLVLVFAASFTALAALSPMWLGLTAILSFLWMCVMTARLV